MGCDEKNINMEFIKLVSEEAIDKNEAKIKEILNCIINSEIEYKEDIVKPLSVLLLKDNIDLQRLSAQAIAEICKCERKREFYAEGGIINPLLNCLNQPITIGNVELIKQACRGLGNVCFDNSVGRDVVLNSSGIPIIVELLDKTLKCESSSLKAHSHKVRLFTCKLLSILMFGGSEYIKPALDANFMDRIYDVIHFEFSSSDGDDDRLHSALLVVSVITEYNRSLIVKDNLIHLIVNILKTIKSLEISEACLECLHYQAEHDEIKTVLANVKVPQILWGLLQKHRSLAIDEETCELMKLTCDLIALILTGDEAMNILYLEGTGEFYQAMVKSLDSDDVELAITSILAIGNFARTDTHCIHMMDTGVFKKLMLILIQHKNHEDDIRLQHVVLSSLRNLVIPQRNKSLAISHGILPVLIEMIPNVAQYHVVFKLLATLRMLVDGQENVAKELVSSNMLDKFAIWGAQAEHAGVAGEASRLLARIVRQLQSQDCLLNIVKVDGLVSCLVNMLASPHIIMQNEAIIALTLLCSALFCRNSTVSSSISDKSNEKKSNMVVDDKKETTIFNDIESLLITNMVKADVGKQINIMLERNYHNTQSEIIENISKFLSLLLNQNLIRAHLFHNKTQTSLQNLLNENSQLGESLRTSIDDLIKRINLSEN